MTDVDDYMTILRESQLKRTIVVEDVDKIISENKRLKEELKEICEKYLKIKTTVSAYEDAYKDSSAYIKKLKDLLKECESSIQYYQETYGAMDLDTYTLLAKLNEVLNE